MSRAHSVAVLLVAVAFTAVACADDKPTAEPSDHGLVERVDAVVAKVKARELRTDKVTPWVIMHAVIAFEDTITVTRPDETKVNAIDFLLTEAKDGDGPLYYMDANVPRIRTRDISPGFKESFILQDHVDQFLMAYADAGVKLDRLGGQGPSIFTVQNLLAAAMMEFKPTQELGWTLVVTSTYVPIKMEWRKAGGELMTTADIVKLAVQRDPNRETEGGTHHLYGIAYALNKWRVQNPGKEAEGVWAEARAYLDKYVAKAKELQNEDGSFSSSVFRGQAIAKTPQAMVWATGHTIEWLVLALEPEQLREPWMVKAVQRLTAEMERTGIESLSEGGYYHAAHGLRIWRQKAHGAE